MELDQSGVVPVSSLSPTQQESLAEHSNNPIKAPAEVSESNGGPPAKRRRLDNGFESSPGTSTNLLADNEAFTYPNPGVYINPPGAREAKQRQLRRPGKPRKALIAVIRSDHLRDLPLVETPQTKDDRSRATTIFAHNVASEHKNAQQDLRTVQSPTAVQGQPLSGLPFAGEGQASTLGAVSTINSSGDNGRNHGFQSSQSLATETLPASAPPAQVGNSTAILPAREQSKTTDLHSTSMTPLGPITANLSTPQSPLPKKRPRPKKASIAEGELLGRIDSASASPLQHGPKKSGAGLSEATLAKIVRLRQQSQKADPSPALIVKLKLSNHRDFLRKLVARTAPAAATTLTASHLNTLGASARPPGTAPILPPIDNPRPLLWTAPSTTSAPPLFEQSRPTLWTAPGSSPVQKALPRLWAPPIRPPTENPRPGLWGAPSKLPSNSDTQGPPGVPQTPVPQLTPSATDLPTPATSGPIEGKPKKKKGEIQRRAGLIMDIMEQCGGIYPGNKEIWYPFATAWQKLHQEVPDQKFADSAVKNLMDSGRLNKVTFTFRSKQGINVTRKVLILPVIDASSPSISEVQQEIIDAHPLPYLPADAEVSEELRAQSQAVSVWGGKPVASVTQPSPEQAASPLPSQAQLNPQGLSTSVRLGDSVVLEQRNKTVETADTTYDKEYVSAHPDEDFHHAGNGRYKRGPRPGTGSTTLSEQRNKIPGSSKTTYDKDYVYAHPDEDFHHVGNGRYKPGPRPGTGNTTQSEQRNNKAVPPEPTYDKDYVYAHPDEEFHHVGNGRYKPGPRPGTGKTTRVEQRNNTAVPPEPTYDKDYVYAHPDQEFYHAGNGRYRLGRRPATAKSALTDSTASVSATKPDPKAAVAPPGHDSVNTQLQNSISKPVGVTTKEAQPDQAAQFIASSHTTTIDQPLWPATLLPPPISAPASQHATPSTINKATQPDSARQESLSTLLERSYEHAPVAMPPPAYEPTYNTFTTGPEVAARPKRKYKSRKKEVLIDYQDAGAFTIGDEYLPSEPPRKKARTKGKETVGPVVDVEQLVMAIALVKTLCGGLKGTRMIWGPIAHALGFNHELQTLKNRWNIISKDRSEDVEKLQEAIREPFLLAYESGELPKVDFQDLQSTDWPALLRWVQADVVPLVRAVEQRAKALTLPKSVAALHTRYETVQPDGVFEADTNAIFNAKVEVVRRSVAIFAQQGSTLHDERNSNAENLAPQDTEVLKTWCRAVALTKQHLYNAEVAAQKIGVFSHEMIKQASDELVTSGILVADKPGRQLPGRNFHMSGAFTKQLMKWPGPDFKYLRQLSIARDAIFTHFQTDDVLQLSYHTNDHEITVLTNMVAQGLLKVTSTLPPKSDDFEAAFPKLSIWGLDDIRKVYNSQARVDRSYLRFPITYERTQVFTTQHGLQSIAIPTRPALMPGETKERIPIWVDIHGSLIDDVWDLVLRSVLYLLVYRTGITASGVEKAHNGRLGAWEVEMMFDWMEKTGLAIRTGGGSERQGVWKGGWRASEWWYCAFSPEIAGWYAPIADMR